jgi:hypothetical protein
MVTIHLDPSRLSLQEMANATRALRQHCAHCVERGVPAGQQHAEEITKFLAALADAIDQTRRPAERRQIEDALGIDHQTGEWDAGA